MRGFGAMRVSARAMVGCAAITQLTTVAPVELAVGHVGTIYRERVHTRVKSVLEVISVGVIEFWFTIQ